MTMTTLDELTKQPITEEDYARMRENSTQMREAQERMENLQDHTPGWAKRTAVGLALLGTMAIAYFQDQPKANLEGKKLYEKVEKIYHNIQKHNTFYMK